MAVIVNPPTKDHSVFTAPHAPGKAVIPPPHPIQPPASGHLRAENVLGLPVRPVEHGQWSVRVLITSSTAAYLLQVGSQRQRLISKRKIEHFVILLQDGRFYLTHQGIGIDWDGLTIDGQHRLLAIKQTGLATEMWVTFNMDPKTFVALDRAPPRTVADDFHIQGITHERSMAITLVAASKQLWDYDNERLPWQTDMRPTAIDLFETESRHPHLVHACRVGRDARRIVPSSAFAAFWALMRERDEPAAELFATKLIKAESMEPDDPVRNVHMFCMMHSGRKKGEFKQEFSVRMVRAWNATRQHRKVRKSLQGVLHTGAPFPRVI